MLLLIELNQDLAIAGRVHQDKNGSGDGGRAGRGLQTLASEVSPARLTTISPVLLKRKSNMAETTLGTRHPA